MSIRKAGFAAAVLCGLSIGMTASQAALMKGQAAPDFTGAALDGRKIILSDYRGKNPVVVGFFARFVPASQKEFAHLKQLDDRSGGKGLKVLAVSLDEDRESPAGLVRQHGARFPVLFDPKSLIGGKYNVQALPHTVVIDRDGKVITVVIGVDRDAVERAVEAALKG